MSLRVKLVLALVALTSVAAVSIGAWSYVATSHLLHDQIDRSLQDTVQLAEVGHTGGRGDPDDSPGPSPYDLARLNGQNPTQRIAPDGDVITATTATVTLPVEDADRAVAAGTSPAVWRDVSIDGVPYRMLTTPTSSGPGALQVARSLAETERVLDSLRNLTLLATLCVVVAAAAIGWLIARQVTRRLARLTGVAEEVATTGRLDVPVPVGGRDEAGRLGTAFNEMLEALGRSRLAQQQLVQDAGHELRTPLTSLRTNISVLRRHDALPRETQARVLDDLDAETRELTALVNELVELATDARDDEPPELVALGPLVERVAERTRRRTGRIVAVTSDDSEVQGRPQALERVVSNLLDNAAKFDAQTAQAEATEATDATDATEATEAGGGAAAGVPGSPAVEQAPIEVDVSAGCVEVRDRGPGIPADDLDHVFDRFHRSVSARSRPGSGLGLAIVRDLVEAHGGRVWATNRPGGGAAVGFSLPLAEPPRPGD